MANKLPLVNNEFVQALETALETPFEAIRKKNNWKPYDASYKAKPNTALWLKFQLENRTEDTLHSYLYSLDHFTTIYQQKGENFKTFKNGTFVPLPERANKSIDFFTELTLEPFKKSQFYVKLNANHFTGILNYPIIYSDKGHFNYFQNNYEYQSNEIAFIYFYIISLITIIIFMVVFWLRLSANLYLYYLGYLFFQLIYGFIVLRSTLAPVGNFFEYFPKLSYNLNEPVQFAFIGFYIFFIINLLTVEKYDKALARALKYLGYACFIYAISRFLIAQFFYDAYLMVLVFTIVRIIILPLNFVLIFWIIFKVKHPLLIYFIVGQSFFFIAALSASYIGSAGLQYSSDSIFGFNESPNIIFQIGLLIEVYCFSLALGENVILLQKEKEIANDALITQLQENKLLQENMNLELDKQISEKTAELIKLYSKIEKEKEQKIKDDFTQKIKETEMVALRSQMNPHFIFNSLSAIKHLIMTSRNDDAVKYLDDFSSLLRGILKNSNLKKITVEEELEILELYLSLEENRMGTEFSYSIQYVSKEALSQFQIPPLLLQPLVENAIWHGLHPSLKIKKKLNVIFDTTENLQIIIEDNGIGRKESGKKKKLHESMGTTIVQDRLTLYNHLNDQAIHFKIIDLENEGRALGTKIILTYED
ncbi:histidine kinase [Aequorivita sp. CIP111184]|uniref:histidine kinase n=1 Tax=Aequorivita sp. CIP111184 TaxID=2211356 RepID=UPI00215BD3DF|nr:histidine kinase [Aequorivita sp. CIP111184]